MENTVASSRKGPSTFHILSPVIAVILSQVVAIALGPALGPWVWAVIVVTYWAVLALFVLTWGGIQQIRAYLGPSTREWLWKLVAVVFGLLTLPLMFIPHHRLLFASFSIWFSSLVLALINPWIEELYWRGVLMDATAGWPKWVSIGYSSLLFAVFHTAFAWTSIACRNPVFLANTFVAGVLYSIIAWRLRSLRWNIFSHFLVNVFGLSTPAFLNMISLVK